jgi:hypothetical protein
MTFTESFIALCREHPIEPEHVFRLGDWYYGIGQDINTHRPGETGMVLVNQNPRPGTASPGYFVWLPRLDQLLDMLEAADAFWARLEINDHEARPEHRFTAEAGLRSRQRMAAMGASREEAAYRLLLAVREAANVEERRPTAE